MHYRLEQRIHTLAHNYIDRASTSTPSFQVEGVVFSAWEYSLETGGREHPYWLASWETEAERYTKAWELFWDKLSIIVPRIAVVSQCYTSYVDEPILILREGCARAFLRYFQDHRGVGLSFMHQELTALKRFLESSDIPDEFYWNWSDATNSTGYSSKLMLMLAAIEALVMKGRPGNKKTDDDYRKLEEVLGSDLKKTFWGEKGDSSNALRHRLAHGRYFGVEHDRLDYVAILHKQVMRYLNKVVLKEQLLNENVTNPQRHPSGGSYCGHSFIVPVGEAELGLISLVSDMNEDCEFTHYERLVVGEEGWKTY